MLPYYKRDTGAYFEGGGGGGEEGFDREGLIYYRGASLKTGSEVATFWSVL